MACEGEMDLGRRMFPASGYPEKPTVVQRSCILCAAFAAWMLNVSRGVATTCVTGENAADATQC